LEIFLFFFVDSRFFKKYHPQNSKRKFNLTPPPSQPNHQIYTGCVCERVFWILYLYAWFYPWAQINIENSEILIQSRSIEQRRSLKNFLNSRLKQGCKRSKILVHKTSFMTDSRWFKGWKMSCKNDECFLFLKFKCPGLLKRISELAKLTS